MRRARVTLAGYPILAALVCMMHGAALAHVGSRVFPVFELPTAELPDLDDGSLADWEAALPLSSIHNEDLHRVQGERDLSDFAFRAFLAWHSATDQVLVGLEIVDDDYVTAAPVETIAFMVDGDHSGGGFFDFGSEGMTEDDRRAFNNSQAQLYYVQPFVQGQFTRSINPYTTWTSEPPWAEFGGSWQGEHPAHVVVEFEVTPWDRVDAEGPDRSRHSSLLPHSIIGLGLVLSDSDSDERVGDDYLPKIYALGEFISVFSTADAFVDAELIPCDVLDCSGASSTAVSKTSWGRIKATFK